MPIMTIKVGHKLVKVILQSKLMISKRDEKISTRSIAPNVSVKSKSASPLHPLEYPWQSVKFDAKRGAPLRAFDLDKNVGQ